MFGVSHGKLIQGLQGAQQRNCCYMGNTCDCKYGIETTSDEKKAAEFWRNDIGEQTGCPEIRQALAMLGALSTSEFNKLAQEAGISLI